MNVGETIMNCAHAEDKTDYDCMACVTVWLWNVVLFCTTCHKAVFNFQYAVESETVGTNDIAIVKYQGKDYVYRDVFWEDHNRMEVTMTKAREALKHDVAIFLGMAGLAAFLDENEGTHRGTDGRVIRRDLGLQEASVHKEEFKYCGKHVNYLEDIKADLATVMDGISIPRYPGKYVCVSELENVMGSSSDTCKVYLDDCKGECLYPTDFNPGDPASVREAVEFALSF
jgi:hypothetical protein